MTLIERLRKSEAITGDVQIRVVGDRRTIKVNAAEVEGCGLNFGVWPGGIDIGSFISATSDYTKVRPKLDALEKQVVRQAPFYSRRWLYV